MVFSLFAGECQGLALALPAKIHSFCPQLLALLRTFGKCARRILEVTLGKSAILPRFITPFLVQRHAAAFHVFAKAKTFHFSAFDMFAFRSLW